MRERCAREVSTTSGRSLAATYLVVAVALALAAFGPPRQTSGLVAPSPPPPPSPTAGHTKVHHQAHHPAKSNHPPRAPPSHLREVSPPPPARAEKRPPTSTRDAGTGVHEVRPAKSAGDAAAARLPPPDAAELEHHSGRNATRPAGVHKPSAPAASDLLHRAGHHLEHNSTRPLITPHTSAHTPLGHHGEHNATRPLIGSHRDEKLNAIAGARL